MIKSNEVMVRRYMSSICILSFIRWGASSTSGPSLCRAWWQTIIQLHITQIS